MKTIVEIYTCECGKNIIILNENFKNANDTDDIRDIQCPVCGGEMVEETTREMELKQIYL